MKKIALIIISVIMTVAGISAQNAFFPTKEGMTLLYVNKNDKGKIESYTSQSIRKVVKSGDNITVNYVGQTLDKNGKATDKFPETSFTVNIHNGAVEMDMKSFAAPGAEASLEITGDKLMIPSNLAPGDKLDDAKCTLKMSMGITIKMDIMFTQQECLAIEDLKVPAGTFKCTKITQTTSAKIMGRTTVTKMLTWYAPGIGTVKRESYDSKGNLSSSSELQSLEN